MGILGNIWTVHNAYLDFYLDVHIKIHVTELNNNQTCFLCFQGELNINSDFHPCVSLGQLGDCLM